MKKKQFIATTLLICALVAAAFASGARATNIDLMDTPTANTLQAGEYYLQFHFYQEGGILLKGSAGLAQRFTIGASYGGLGIIGTGAIEGNPEPAFSLKYKVSEEGKDSPVSIAVGYDGQGYGKYYRQGEQITLNGDTATLTRSFYQVNSKGFYVVFSKGFEELNLDIHGGINHSLEDDPGKAGISFFLGGEFEILPNFSLKLEYNNGFHGPVAPQDVFEEPGIGTILRKAGGEINLGFKIAYSPQLALEIGFKDISSRYTESGNRTFQIIYSGEF